MGGWAMYTRNERPKESEGRSVESTNQPQSGVGHAFQFVDDRREAVVQRKFQAMANNYSAQRNQASSGVIQKVDTPGKPPLTDLTRDGQGLRGREKVNDLEDQKIWAEVIFSGGLAYKKTGGVDGRKAQAKILDGKQIYALGPNQQIYVRFEPHGVPRADEFTHANFLSGAAVKTAGQMFIRGGQITRLDNESGHYKPGDTTLEWMLHHLNDNGVNLSAIMLVMLGSEGIYNAQQYYTQPSLDGVGAIPEKVKRDDEDYQKQYDAHIDSNTIKFEYFGWPNGPLRENDWRPKMHLIRQRVMSGRPVVSEIEFHPKAGTEFKGERKDKTAAIAAIDKMLATLGLSRSVTEILPLVATRSLLQFTVIRPAD